MSRYQNNKCSQPPPRWLHCPRKASSLVVNKFLAFKTPLSADYNDAVPEACRWDVSWVFDYCKNERRNIGLWIDLTNTNRFYDKEDVTNQGCKYFKLNCRGRGERPSLDQTKLFIKICQNFIRNNPLDIIGVHCTHGFNRTGFLIACYLVENFEWPVDKALKEFAEVRPPGIYKGDYIEELFKRYDDPTDWENFSHNIHPIPPRPAWCLEDEEEEEDEDESTSDGRIGEPHSKRRKHEIVKTPIFMSGVPGVTPVTDYQKVIGIQRKVQQICNFSNTRFPGCQPVSMNMQNIKLLGTKPYRVSWKADGTRYMLLIEGNGETYFLDRDNSVFQIRGISFPLMQDRRKRLQDTLLDGEMVIDKANGKDVPRYLVYDVLMFNGKNVRDLGFHPHRYSIIERDIIAARTRAFTEGILRRESEPFSIRAKHFWDVDQASSLLSEKFAKQLLHEPDGLIFQPAKDRYVCGTCDEVLKWKPETHNSVDFKLKITMEGGVGVLPRKIGELYVGGLNKPFDFMKITKNVKEMNDKIIECVYENNQWVFIRERTDKSFPNHFRTAESVCESIRNPVTKEILLNYIEKKRFMDKDDSELMPPPRMR